MKKRPHKVIRLRGGGTAYVWNRSSLPDALVYRMVRHALGGVNVGRLAVHLTDGGPRTRTLGRAHYFVPGMSPARGLAQHLITVRNCYGIESTVGTIAHEGAHIEDWRENRYRRNKQLRRTERSARRLENIRVQTWREEEARRCSSAA